MTSQAPGAGPVPLGPSPPFAAAGPFGAMAGRAITQPGMPGIQNPGSYGAVGVPQGPTTAPAPGFMGSPPTQNIPAQVYQGQAPINRPPQPQMGAYQGAYSNRPQGPPFSQGPPGMPPQRPVAGPPNLSQGPPVVSSQVAMAPPSFSHGPPTTAGSHQGVAAPPNFSQGPPGMVAPPNFSQGPGMVAPPNFSQGPGMVAPPNFSGMAAPPNFSQGPGMVAPPNFSQAPPGMASAPNFSQVPPQGNMAGTPNYSQGSMGRMSYPQRPMVGAPNFPPGVPPMAGPPGPARPLEPPVAQFRDMAIGQGQVAPPPFMARPPTSGQPTWQPPYPPITPGADHFSQPGSPAAGPPVSGGSRIDPSQIPRPHSTSTVTSFETLSSSLPPSATSNFFVKDSGNCSPRFMRSTLYQIPCSGDLLATTGMPLALVVQPFALPHPAEEPIKVVDFGESGPVRCSRCKAYINPFVKFIDQGRRFICNLCGHSNETPRDYFANLGPDGKRRDAEERPELSRGTVEFIATRDYMVRPPMPPVFFFLVDVSATAIKMGATAAACSAIHRVLADLPEGSRTLVGVATFDSTIHFYNLNKDLQQPAMLVVPDIQDVYTPIGNGLVVPISEGREHMESLLENIPNMFQDNQVQESAFGAAIQGSFLALKPTGGKLLVFQSVLPSVGIGALTAREAEARAAGEKDAHKVLQPVDKTIRSMAEKFAEFQVCVDLFLTTQTYVDIASLSVVPRTTGGQVYYYFPFSATMDSAKLYNDLRWNVTRPQGLEAVMRVRCSQGLRVENYYGSFRQVKTDVDLPAIDCDKTILVTFKHEEKFQEGAECCFQSALLYTATDGQRRIRVSTLSLPCTSVLGNLFKGADLDAHFTYLLKHAAQTVPTAPLSQVREQTIDHCVQSLYAYRKFCATASSSGQLILPECLKLLPLYTLALTKSIGLRQDARVDERSYWLMRVTSISSSLAIPLVYPRMFAVHNLSAKQEEEALPPTLPLSSENLDSAGIFLLETGEDAFLYAGKAASPELLHQLFEVRSVNEVIPGQFLLQEFDNEPSMLLNKLVNEIRRQRCSYLRLHLLKRGDPLEFLFHSFLVEDKTAMGSSYVEFLIHVHKQIQLKMQSNS